LALGLGFVLIALALAVNIVIHSLSRTEQEGRW
jgi:tungstate transport system permease protein